MFTALFVLHRTSCLRIRSSPHSLCPSTQRRASTMTKILCVAEKPSIAKAVSRILGGGQVNTGESGNKFVKNYEFTFNFGGQWGNCHCVMTSVLGHTLSTDLPPEYNAWHNYPPSIPFDVRPITEVDKDKKAIARNIQNQARSSQILYIWTDCDREGEYIGTEVRDLALKVNPRLTVKRAKFSNIEPSHILSAARRPVDIDERQAQAVAARIELDLRIGAAFTRLQTLKLKTVRGLDGRVLSYGSCQFPTLGFVVDRYRRILKFVKEPFWSIKVTHKRDNKGVTFNWKRGRLFDRMAVTIIFEQCLQAKVARVKSAVDKPTKKWRPLPLTTVELQKQGSRFLGIPSKQIMKLAESLYNNGFISYPRTETDQFDKDMDLRALVQKQTNHSVWGQYAQGLMGGAFRQPRNGKNNDKAHPPIHPVVCVQPDALNGDERRVYEFVTRRFLACCSDDAVGRSTTITLSYGPEEFTAGGLIVMERNYLDVYPYDKWSDNEIPDFTQGEEFVPDAAEMTEGKTSPPTFLTEPELIALMDANGIGTDATMAEHIQTIIDRKYVYADSKGGGAAGGGGDDEGAGAGGGSRGRGRGRGGGATRGGRGGTSRGGGGGMRQFVPSNLGLALVEGYDQMQFDVNLSKPFLRKEMEEKMKAICEGRKTREEVVAESLEMYRSVFQRAEGQIDVLKRSCIKHLTEE